MSVEGNYLTRLAGPEQRAHRRRATNMPGKVFYLRRGIRGYTSQPCKMLNISESGCLVSVPLPDQTSDHLYLVLDDLQAKIACATVARSENGLHLKFRAEMPTKTVDELARMKFVRKKQHLDL